MRLGVHTSIAGGLHRAPGRGKELGCDVIQIFSSSPNQWKTRPLTPEILTRFQQAVSRTCVGPVAIHSSYLINLATPSKQHGKRSREAFFQEMERAEALGVPFVIAHPGAHAGSGEKKGLDRIAQRISRLHRQTSGFRTRILLETTAGQGNSLGSRFEHFQYLFQRVHEPERLGICLDTCHIFAAGYDIRSREGCENTLNLFHRLVGLHRLRLIHLNDSKTSLGSRVDRHEHIGQGEIGRKGFINLLNDPRLQKLPMVLETPKGKGTGEAEDRKNLRAIRNLHSSRGVPEISRKKSTKKIV